MNIPSVSIESSLAAAAAQSRSSGVQNQISMAVMKQTMESQEAMGDALVEMISTPMPRIDGTGSILDIAA